jgi:hypothetical protein
MANGGPQGEFHRPPLGKGEVAEQAKRSPAGVFDQRFGFALPQLEAKVP